MNLIAFYVQVMFIKKTFINLRLPEVVLTSSL